jgi:hypothetical protein
MSWEVPGEQAAAKYSSVTAAILERHAQKLELLLKWTIASTEIQAKAPSRRISGSCAGNLLVVRRAKRDLDANAFAAHCPGT